MRDTTKKHYEILKEAFDKCGIDMNVLKNNKLGCNYLQWPDVETNLGDGYKPYLNIDIDFNVDGSFLGFSINR